MASKQVLIGAVAAVSTLSLGAGTFLAYRANQTATPVIEATATSAPEPFAPAPAPDAMISIAPPPAPVSRPAPPQRPAAPAETRRETPANSRARVPAAAPTSE